MIRITSLCFRGLRINQNLTACQASSELICINPDSVVLHVLYVFAAGHPQPEKSPYDNTLNSKSLSALENP